MPACTKHTFEAARLSYIPKRAPPFASIRPNPTKETGSGHKKILSQFRETGLKGKKAVPRRCETTSAGKKVLSRCCETTLEHKKVLSQTCETISESKKVLSQHCETILEKKKQFRKSAKHKNRNRRHAFLINNNKNNRFKQ